MQMRGQTQFNFPGGMPPTAARSAGDMSPDEWLDRPDVKFHGTVVNPDREPHLQPETHWGTRGIASRMVGQRSADQPGDPYDIHEGYDDGSISLSQNWREYDEDDDDAMDAYGEGRVHARRLSSGVSERVLSDTDANRAHVLRAYDRGDTEVSASVGDSARGVNQVSDFTPGPSLHAAVGELNGGRAVPYQNEVEGDPSVRRPLFPGERVASSWLVPDAGKTTSSWEQDVLASPNRSHMAKQFAETRLARGQELTAPIESKRKIGEQTRINHYSTTDADGKSTSHTQLGAEPIFGTSTRHYSH